MRNEGVQLIIAHAGIADMAGLAGRLGGRPGVFFDTSVWSGLDLLDLYRQIAPEQVLYASDYPYGRQPNSLLVAVRTAKLAGFDDKQLRLMLGGNARRIAEGEELAPLSTPKGATSLVQPLTFARIHQYISMAVPLLWLRQRDAVGAIGLAVNASRERGNGHHEEAERIQELLVTAQELWRDGAELVSVRTAKLAGFDDKQLRLMLGGSALRIAERRELEQLSPPRGLSSLVQPLTFARSHQYVSMAVPMLWLRQGDAIGALGLAVNASRERGNGHPEESERIQELLVTAQELWRDGTERTDHERVAAFRAAIQLVNLADMVSLTTRA